MRADFVHPCWRPNAAVSIAAVAAGSTTAALPVDDANRPAQFVMVWMDTQPAVTGLYLEFGAAGVAIVVGTAPIFHANLFRSMPLIVRCAGATHVAVRTIGADAEVRVTPLEVY